MCGICGVWEYGAASGRGVVELSLVERMRDRMAHRGPDDAGAQSFDEGRLALGHRRLSIVDLSPAGHNPMRGCAASEVWTVFNGEIYNHAALREGLAERGHAYRSRTDTETILHLYEERGLDFVHSLEGDYAIALWDAPRERLVLVRDRVGVKPLYFYHGAGRFIFASEIKAILEHPAVAAEVDERQLYQYLTFLTTPAPRTLFRDIQKLPAGHMLTIGRDGNARVTRYWDALPPERAATNGSLDAESQRREVLRLLRDSIRKRMMSDVPFGVFLSGGVDSSANVALMSELTDRPVRTFTVGFNDAEELNELDAAREVSGRFRTDHHEVLIGEDEMRRFLPDLVFHQDEPVADPVCVPLYYVSRLARETGTAVVQVGEGSDEIFGGYDWMRKYLRIEERFWRHAARAPHAARTAAAALARPVLERAGAGRAAVDLARRLGAGESLFWGGVVVFDEALKSRVLSESMRARAAGLSSYDEVRAIDERFTSSRPGADFLARMAYLELKLRLPELLLMRVDKITMANSVEARVPFLDHELVEYAMALPRTAKVEGASGKHVLKRALENVLPRELLHTRKRGFGAPVHRWFRGAGGVELAGKLLNSPMRRRDFLDYDFVARMAEEHRRGSREWGFHLWALLNLTLWYERWIERA